MSKAVTLSLVALALTGCTTMTDYYPDAQVVQIGGRPFFVAPQDHLGAGVYLSGPNDPKMNETVTGMDMTLPVSNVAAIEAATGCQVIPATIRNTPHSSTTHAAVTC